MLRYSSTHIYICSGTSDVKVLDSLGCVGAFDDKVLCFCVWVYFGVVVYLQLSSKLYR